MKRNILALFLFGLISSGAYAQDDMYFTPKKTEKVVKEVAPVASYHENHMDVDEYNRRGFWGNEGYVQASDTTASDVIDFSPSDSLQTTASAGAEGEYDESYNPEDDYVYSRRMSRFDDFIGTILGIMGGMDLIGMAVHIGMLIQVGMVLGMIHGIMDGTGLGAMDGIIRGIGQFHITDPIGA